MSRDWSAGTTATWRIIRRAVLRANASANGGRCAVDVGAWCERHAKRCRGVCTGMATQVHHTKGKRFGDTARHLKATCRACNLHLGDPAAYNPQPRPHSRW